MVQKRPNILDFQIENHLLYYKFPKYYVGFYSIRLYDANIVGLLMKILKKNLNNDSILGVIDICGENIFLFIKINVVIKPIIAAEIPTIFKILFLLIKAFLSLKSISFTVFIFLKIRNTNVRNC